MFYSQNTEQVANIEALQHDKPTLSFLRCVHTPDAVRCAAVPRGTAQYSNATRRIRCE